MFYVLFTKRCGEYFLSRFSYLIEVCSEVNNGIQNVMWNVEIFSNQSCVIKTYKSFAMFCNLNTSPPTSVEVKETWIYTSSPQYVFMT
jgi:hypothetical protein